MEKLTFTIKDNGDQVYRNQAGQFHNPVGPAVIVPNDFKEYWLNDKRHNENGPAVVHSDGYKAYWLNGKLHNEDGPAVIDSDGTEKYYLNHKFLSKKEWEKQIKPVKEVTMTELHELLGYEVKIKE